MRAREQPDSRDDPMANPDLDKRCGSCARFVRVIETVDENGEVKREGECLLMVWPPPLYEHNTCSQYVKRGTFTAKPAPKARSPRLPGTGSTGISHPRRVPFQGE